MASGTRRLARAGARVAPEAGGFSIVAEAEQEVVPAPLAGGLAGAFWLTAPALSLLLLLLAGGAGVRALRSRPGSPTASCRKPHVAAAPAEACLRLGAVVPTPSGAVVNTSRVAPS